MNCGLGVVLLAAACGGEPPRSDAPIDDGFDRNALLDHLARQVLLPIQEDFAVKAAAMPQVIEAHCTALDSGTPGTTLDTARTAVTTAIDAWERADAALVGPAAMNQYIVRDSIYGWPLLSPCEVDRDVASRWADPGSYDVTTEQVNARSLTAIEYLLYPQGTNHNCFAEPPGWTALPLPRARCRLAHAIAVDVVAQGAALEAAWQPSGGDYTGELARAGASSSIASAHAGVNLVSDSLFYVDKMVKDMKLAQSAGIAINVCDAVQTPCTREVELLFSDRATFAIRANLKTLREVFTGVTPSVTGPGFDDFLIAVGQQELADRMVANIDASIAQAAALPDSFLTALSANYAGVVATHAAVRNLTDDLKSQFLTVLALEIPDDVATDND